MKDITKLSVLLPTFNNEQIVRKCLESVKWANEILVVDSFSTDRTLDICCEYGARIIQHEYIHSAKQKNWAVPQCVHEWVLQIDSDEILEPGAEEEIRRRIDSASADLHAFRIPRKNHIMGEWIPIADLYPDYQTRLLRRDVGRWEDKEVHAHVLVPGRAEILEHHILHYGMNSISKQLSNIDRYSRYQADEMNKHGKQFHWYQLIFRPFAVFLKRYLWQGAWQKGYRGFLVCAVTTTFDFWAHSKLWEIQKFGLKASPK